MMSRSPREYPDQPLIGVGAVVLNQAGQVLLIRRGREPRAGEWSLPGGLVRLGERLAEAVAREVLEECHVKVNVRELLGTFELIERDASGRPRFHYVVLDYLAEACSDDIQPDTDAAEARWVDESDLAGYHLRRETRDMIARALRRHRAAGSPSTSVLGDGLVIDHR